jgi:hypothetical protein
MEKEEHTSRIVEEGNTFQIVKPAPAINYKELARLIYTGNTQLPNDPRKRSMPSFIEAMHRKLPHAERGKEFYANLLTAMAGEIPKGGEKFKPVRPPYFNELIFREAHAYAVKKLEAIAEKEKPEWTMEQVSGILIYKNLKIEDLNEAKKYAKHYHYKSKTSGRRLKLIYDKFTVYDYRVKHIHKLESIEKALKPTQTKRLEKEREINQIRFPKSSVKKV